MQNTLEEALHEIPNNVDNALDLFVDCVTSASHCMKKTFTVGCSTSKMQNWFDKECIDVRRKTRSKLRKYRHSKEETDRLDYVIERRDYHKLIRKKKQTYKRKKVDYLSSIIGQPSAFWKEVRACAGMRPRKTLDNSISKTDWVNHFKEIHILAMQDSEVEQQLNDLLLQDSEVEQQCNDLLYILIK